MVKAGLKFDHNVNIVMSESFLCYRSYLEDHVSGKIHQLKVDVHESTSCHHILLEVSKEGPIFFKIFFEVFITTQKHF